MDVVLGELRAQVGYDRLRQAKPVDLNLDPNFPKTGNAEEKVIRTRYENFASPWGKLRVIRYRAKKRVRIN
jgi:hypothetical protein